VSSSLRCPCLRCIQSTVFKIEVPERWCFVSSLVATFLKEYASQHVNVQLLGEKLMIIHCVFPGNCTITANICQFFLFGAKMFSFSSLQVFLSTSNMQSSRTKMSFVGCPSLLRPDTYYTEHSWSTSIP
jgi:hypothetical protein